MSSHLAVPGTTRVLRHIGRSDVAEELTIGFLIRSKQSALHFGGGGGGGGGGGSSLSGHISLCFCNSQSEAGDGGGITGISTIHFFTSILYGCFRKN